MNLLIHDKVAIKNHKQMPRFHNFETDFVELIFQFRDKFTLFRFQLQKVVSTNFFQFDLQSFGRKL